jgi:uncharacterized membrane protein (UPF0127 family)
LGNGGPSLADGLKEMRDQKFRLGPLWAFIPWLSFMNTSSELPDELTIKVGSKDCTQGKVYRTQLALTPGQWKKGLSKRKTPLNDHEGMLFIFDKPTAKTFWMKDTWIPLSIFFFSEKGTLLSATEMSVEPNPKDPKILYEERRPVSLVLEAASGDAIAADTNLNHLCIESVISTGSTGSTEQNAK